MEKLPLWILTHDHPAMYDHESYTAIEMVAKIYGKMNALIGEYNETIERLNEKIDNFMSATDKNYEVFTLEIRQEFQDFIDVIDLKIQSQDAKIQDAVDFMKTHLATNVEKLMEQLLNDGIIHENLNVVYDEATENLNIELIVTNGGE